MLWDQLSTDIGKCGTNNILRTANLISRPCVKLEISKQCKLLPDIGKWRCKISAAVSRMPDLCTPRVKFPEKLSVMSGFSAAKRAKLPLPLLSLMPEVSWTGLLWSYRSPSCCLCPTTCQWAWNFWEVKANPLTGKCLQAGWVGMASSKAASKAGLDWLSPAGAGQDTGTACAAGVT